MQRSRAETLDEPPQLGRRERALPQVDEGDREAALLEEPLRCARALVAVEAEHLDEG